MGNKLNYYKLSTDSCHKQKHNLQHGIDTNPTIVQVTGFLDICVAHAWYVSALGTSLWLRPTRMELKCGASAMRNGEVVKSRNCTLEFPDLGSNPLLLR